MAVTVAWGAVCVAVVGVGFIPVLFELECKRTKMLAPISTMSSNPAPMMIAMLLSRDRVGGVGGGVVYGELRYAGDEDGP